jgi:hypothetical protein
LSEDVRNSLYLWAIGLAFAGLFWAALHFHWLTGVSDRWLWPLVGIVAAINLAQTGRGLWERRASNPNIPNRNVR